MTLTDEQAEKYIVAVAEALAPIMYSRKYKNLGEPEHKMLQRHARVAIEAYEHSRGERLEDVLTEVESFTDNELSVYREEDGAWTATIDDARALQGLSSSMADAIRDLRDDIRDAISAHAQEQGA